MNRFHRYAVLFAAALCVCAGAAHAGPTTLKFSLQNPENSFSTNNGIKKWIEKVEQDSNGTLSIDLYAGETLCKGAQSWSAVRNNITDIAWIPMGMYAGMNPLAEAIFLPSLPFSDPMTITRTANDLFEKIPALSKPYSANRIIAIYTSDSNNLVTSRPVRTLEDLKGLKIRTTAGPFVPMLEALGAVPVVMGNAEVYDALSKKTIDGVLASWETIDGSRFYEVAPYVTTNSPFGFSLFTIAMNRKKFDRLPDEARNALLKNGGMDGALWLAENFSFATRKLAEPLQAKGAVTIYELPAEERARWDKVAGHMTWERWMKDTLESGKVAREDAETVLGVLTGEKTL